MLQRNEAGQSVMLFAFHLDRTSNIAVTGHSASISCDISLDDGAASPASNAVLEAQNGFYRLPLSQGETNAKTVDVFAVSSNNSIAIIPVYFSRYTSGNTMQETTGVGNANVTGTAAQPQYIQTSGGRVEGEQRLLSRHSDVDGIVWPVTLAEFKAHAQIQHDVEDEQLKLYLQNAVEEVEQRGQVALIKQQVRVSLGRMPCNESIAIPRGPLISVESVGYLDANGNEASLVDGWRADTKSGKGTIYFGNTGITALEGTGTVWIETTVGYGESPVDVPGQWKEIVLILATYCYQRRELISGGGLDESMDEIMNRKIQVAGRRRRYV